MNTFINYDYDSLIKCIVIGEMGVGKSCFCHKYFNGESRIKLESTIGIDFFCKIINDKENDKTYKVQLYDTAGQERFKSCVLPFFRFARLAIIMIDLTNPDCIEHLKDWYDLAQKNCKINTEYIVIGNKSDLDVKVNREDLSNVLLEYKLDYIEMNIYDDSCNKLNDYIIQHFKDDYILETKQFDIDHVSSKNKCCIIM